MNTNKTFIQNLTVGQTFALPGNGTPFTVERVSTTDNLTRVDYRTESGLRATFTKVRLTTAIIL